jgi:hypothetical protein
MTHQEAISLIQQPEYDFLRNNPHLGQNIILLGLSGSHAYGTNLETSDVDIRGVALNSKSEILLNLLIEFMTQSMMMNLLKFIEKFKI